MRRFKRRRRSSRPRGYRHPPPPGPRRRRAGMRRHPVSSRVSRRRRNNGDGNTERFAAEVQLQLSGVGRVGGAAQQVGESMAVGFRQRAEIKVRRPAPPPASDSRSTSTLFRGVEAGEAEACRPRRSASGRRRGAAPGGLGAAVRGGVMKSRRPCVPMRLVPVETGAVVRVVRAGHADLVAVVDAGHAGIAELHCPARLAAALVARRAGSGSAWCRGSRAGSAGRAGSA